MAAQVVFSTCAAVHLLFLLSLRQCRVSKLPGGWRSAEYTLRAFSVGYFACAQYDVLFLLVIASVSVAIPVSKVRGVYSVLYSDGLPQSLRSFAMTTCRAMVR